MSDGYIKMTCEVFDEGGALENARTVVFPISVIRQYNVPYLEDYSLALARCVSNIVYSLLWEQDNVDVFMAAAVLIDGHEDRRMAALSAACSLWWKAGDLPDYESPEDGILIVVPDAFVQPTKENELVWLIARNTGVVHIPQAEFDELKTKVITAQQAEVEG